MHNEFSYVCGGLVLDPSAPAASFATKQRTAENVFMRTLSRCFYVSNQI
jgi:hypothetical protein